MLHGEIVTQAFQPVPRVCRRLDVESLFRRCLPMVFSLETSSSRYSSSVTIHRIGGTPCATGSHRLERPVPASPFTLTSGPFEAPISLRPAPRRADRGCRRNAAPRYRPPGASAMVMAFAWTLSPTNNRSFFMVWLTPFCRPSGPAFGGSVSASLRLLCIGLLTGDTATAVTPPLRLCAVLPRNPRHRLSVKSRQEADTRVSPYQL